MIRTFEQPDDNARIVPLSDDGSLPNLLTLRRDFVPPLPVGAYLVKVARIIGYRPDCDGSAMADIEFVDRHGERTGWAQSAVGLYPDSSVTVDAPEDLWSLAGQAPAGG